MHYDEGTHSLIANQESTYNIKDHLGSVHSALGINTQTLFSNSYYQPYGVDAGSNYPRSTYPLSDFRYAGMFYLPYQSMYLTRYRAYITGGTVDFSGGRWLSRDPIAEQGGINLYGYVEGNPVNFNDPLGLNPLAGAIAGGEIGAAAGPIGSAVGAIIGGIGGAMIADSIIDKIEKAKERKEYSSICKTPIIPTGDKCVDAQANLNRLEQCLQLRVGFGSKWYSDGEPGHELKNQQVQTAIDKLKKWISDNCGKQCD
ncbi:MAG: RHS repeat-associated core domain-containing protein [Methylococcales bacterium]|nr:RHS repeat-associated core domain-containing protein [Methylococcales bacterium]